MENRTTLRKTRVGRVVSNKNDKTITVVVEKKVKHALYNKYILRSKKYTAHDANNECQIGDLVKLMETRPISKSKRWRLIEVLERLK